MHANAEAKVRDATVETRINHIFSKDLELDVDVHTELIETGVLDSTAFVRLLLALEKEFGVEVDVATLDLEDFASIARIARYVSEGKAMR